MAETTQQLSTLESDPLFADWKKKTIAPADPAVSFATTQDVRERYWNNALKTFGKTIDEKSRRLFVMQAAHDYLAKHAKGTKAATEQEIAKIKGFFPSSEDPKDAFRIRVDFQGAGAQSINGEAFANLLSKRFTNNNAGRILAAKEAVMDLMYRVAKGEAKLTVELTAEDLKAKKDDGDET